MKFSTEVIPVPTGVEIAQATVTESIQAINNALNSFHHFMGYIIPRKEIKRLIFDLDKYRDRFSIEIASLIADTRVHATNGIDSFLYASQKINELVSLIESHLKLYVKLFDGGDGRKAATQKQLLIEILDNGVEQLTAAQVNLGDSSLSFDFAVVSLRELRKYRFGSEYDDMVENFESRMAEFPTKLRSTDKQTIRSLLDRMSAIMDICTNLWNKVAQSSQNIAYAKGVFRKEIQSFTDMKIEMHRMMTFDNLEPMSDFRAVTIQSAQNVIAKCEDYRNKHAHSN